MAYRQTLDHDFVTLDRDGRFRGMAGVLGTPVDPAPALAPGSQDPSHPDCQDPWAHPTTRSTRWFPGPGHGFGAGLRFQCGIDTDRPGARASGSANRAESGGNREDEG